MQIRDELDRYLRARGILSLDDADLSRAFGNARRADYRCEENGLMFEVKTITFNPEQKIYDELDRHRNRPDFPLVFGEVPVKHVLRHLPDGEQISHTMNARITRLLRKLIKGAGSQLTETCRRFDSDEKGILIILNDDVPVLSPKIVLFHAYMILKEEHKRDGAGKGVDLIVLLLTSHTYVLSDGRRATIACLMDGPRSTSSPAQVEAVKDLVIGWARFCGSEIFEVNQTGFGDVPAETRQPEVKWQGLPITFLSFLRSRHSGP